MPKRNSGSRCNPDVEHVHGTQQRRNRPLGHGSSITTLARLLDGHASLQCGLLRPGADEQPGHRLVAHQAAAFEQRHQRIGDAVRHRRMPQQPDRGHGPHGWRQVHWRQSTAFVMPLRRVDAVRNVEKLAASCRVRAGGLRPWATSTPRRRLAAGHDLRRAASKARRDDDATCRPARSATGPEVCTSHTSFGPCARAIRRAGPMSAG